MNIDWSKAPEGATHFISTSAAKYWFKKVGDNFYAYNGTGWNANHANPSGVSMREMFEIPRPKPTENPVDQPKTLTQAVFDGLPPEYRWAAVDSEGRAYAHKCTPKGATAAYWLCVRGCAAYLIGEGYDTTNWQNSLIERPAVVKKNLTTELPEWCRVGKWVYYPRLNQRGQIVDFRDGGKKVFIKYPDRSPCSIPYISEVKPLTLIPWDDSTLPSLPFCVKFKNDGKNFRTTVVSASISGVWLGGATNAISYDELSNECEMLDGKPCGVLEVVE